MCMWRERGKRKTLCYHDWLALTDIGEAFQKYTT